MPKIIELNGVGTVRLYKKRGNRNIRLGFDSNGEVRISLPSWASYESGVRFAIAKADWIISHRTPKRISIKNSARIGKAHTLEYMFNESLLKPRLLVKNQIIRITMQSPASIDTPEVQGLADKGCRRALRNEGESLLPKRLAHLANKHKFSYKSVTVKQLKAKWGSCDNQKNLVLNFYLMQLPWELIDYVLLHELVHTEHLNHSLDFWRRFEDILPGAKKIRKQLKEYKTTVVTGPPLSVD